MPKKDLVQNLKKNTRTMTPAAEPVTTTPDVASTPEKTKPKGKPGRPKKKTEPVTHISIAVPVTMYERMQVAKFKHGNNLTQYINDIIQADLDANADEYSNIQNILNS